MKTIKELTDPDRKALPKPVRWWTCLFGHTWTPWQFTDTIKHLINGEWFRGGYERECLKCHRRHFKTPREWQ